MAILERYLNKIIETLCILLTEGKFSIHTMIAVSSTLKGTGSAYK